MHTPEDPALDAIKAMEQKIDEVFDKFGNPTAPYLTIDNYKKLSFKCRSCSWWGIGGELEMGEVFDSLFEIECPKCHTYIGAIGYPVIDVQQNQASYSGLMSKGDPLYKSRSELFSQTPVHDTEEKVGKQQSRPNCRILNIPD